jgi:diguanylate cyclase (GGDEF)-like protein
MSSDPMINKLPQFLSSILDSVLDHIVVIDRAGNFVYLNRGWVRFAQANSFTTDYDWSKGNYLDACDKAAAAGDIDGHRAVMGIRAVIDHKQPLFYFEYPCHSPSEKRWFMMRVIPLHYSSGDYFVISHQNITERVLAENEIKKLAQIDGLCQIYNRRTFNELFHNEWLRCARSKKPICMAIVDLDHFKLINDTYGHEAGDECLVKIGEALKEFVQRPGDICARYGGEEFVITWSDITFAQATQLSKNLLAKMISLDIRNEHSPTYRCLTASIGLAQMIPDSRLDETELIRRADDMLYRAKDAGRNRVVSEDTMTSPPTYASFHQR